MDRILYCPGPFSTYNARFMYTQEKDEVMLEKQKDIIELCGKYNLTLHIKAHPSGEQDNYAHFSYLSKNYPNVRVIGGYWKWFLNAERLIPKYQLVILDIIRTKILPVMARSEIPCIIYTRGRLIEKERLGGLRNMFHVVRSRKNLNSLLKEFSFGQLYIPEQEQLLKKWFTRRETIQKWYKVGWKYFMIRREYRHEWKSDETIHMSFKKLIKRLKRIRKPPIAHKDNSAA